MRIIYGLKQVKRYPKPVVALGVFDGVHLGHWVILKAAVKKAKEIGGRSIVVTFYPHPQKEQSIYSLKHRLRIIEELGVDVCIVIRFDSHFAHIRAQDFIKRILVAKIGARYIYVGKNFRFGRGACGGIRLLEAFSLLAGYRLKIFDVVKINQQAISSTYIRELISQGKLNLAEKLLGRPVSIFGTVIRGTTLARKLGYPTANINPHHEVLPPSGIYAVRVLVEKKRLSGVCYIGHRPTFAMQQLKPPMKYQRHIEVHVFNFHKNIYAQELEVQFIKKIRDEKKFSSAQLLTTQIHKDIDITQKLFSYH